MTAITVTARNQASFDGATVVVGTAATVPDGYTWATGMKRVDQVFMQPDLGKTWTWSQSAGTVTFSGSSLAALSAVSLKAIGV
jgi:hypothetical protein